MSYSANRELAGSFAAAAAPVMHRQRMAAPMSRKAKVFYEPPAKTKEYAETNYYKIKSGNTSELVPVNAFWKDYAVHIANSPDTKFLPKSVSIPATYTDALFSLAVVDLPFNLENAHTMKPDGDSLDIVTATPAVIFHKEVIPAELEQSTIIVSENFFDPENEHKIENGERVQLYVTEEFLVGKVYGSTVTLTNGSSSTQRIETLYQVPQGSIPVKNGSYTKGKFETIRPYSIITFNYFFYFPRPGSFKHFPIHATKDKKVIAAAQPTTLKVVEQFSKNDFTSWEFIAERGSNEQALNFLSTQNITNVNLASIAWRMRDKDFLVAITDLLRKLYVYEDSIWSYGLYHDIPKLVSEYISRQRSFIDCCKPVLHSPLLKVDPEEYNYIYEHLDYFPLINARAHQLGKSRQILNDRFKQQYEKLLHILALKRNNTESDKLAVTSYLILQDRVEEAINYFQTINPTADDDKHVSPLQLQYDYMACYLDLFNDVPTKAPVIAAKYTNYPVPRWNSLFKDIRNKIASITDASIVVQDSTDEERDRDRQQASMAETAPHFTFSVESKQITIDYENIDKCTINYYVMDIEVTFSINPFDRQDLGSYVTPNKHQEVNLPADRKSVTVDLPAEYHNSNIMIDIKAQGIRKSKPYYSHSLNVHVIQNYGQVKVLHSATRKPISKAYVKVYSRQHNNVVTFYKDGYTDLAGTFDYSSLSTDDLDQVSLFAILVVSDQYGAVIVEAAPPAHAH